MGSARAINRLTREHYAHHWIGGGVQVNYHTLSDFRTEHDAAMDGLAPDLVALIVAGRQPPSVTLHWLQRHAIPVAWPEQRELFARFREGGACE